MSKPVQSTHVLATALQVRLIVHPSGQLTPEDLGEVIQALYEARAKWYHTGFQLKLPVGTLDAIQSEFSDTTDCITEMCIHWLKRIDLHPSWAALTKALESPLVGEGHLAQQLRDKYCRGREETITHVYPTSKPTPSGAPPISQGSYTEVTLWWYQELVYGIHTCWCI